MRQGHTRLAEICGAARCLCRYGMVSGLCFLFNNSLLVALDRAGSPLLVSIAMSFCIVTPSGYVLHCLLTFRRPTSLDGFARYMATMSVNIPLAVATLWLWRDVAALPMVWAAPFSIGTSTIVNFALCRFAVFGRREALVTLVQ